MRRQELIIKTFLASWVTFVSKSMLTLGIGTIFGGAKQYAVLEVLALDQHPSMTALAIVSLSFQDV